MAERTFLTPGTIEGDVSVEASEPGESDVTTGPILMPSASGPSEFDEVLAPVESEAVHRMPPASAARWLSPLLIGALVAIPAVVAYATASAQPPLYEARAEMVHTSSGNAQADSQHLLTQVSLLRSQGFLAEAGVLADRSVADVEESFSVEQVDASGVLRLAYRDEDAAAALATVTDVADAYLARSVDGAGEEVRAQEMELLSGRLLTAMQALTTTQDEIAALGSRDNPEVPGQPDPAARGPLDRLRFDRTVLANEVRLLQTELLELERAALIPPAPAVAMVGAPYLLDEPVAPAPLRSAAVGALVGAMVAASYWFVWQRKRHAG